MAFNNQPDYTNYVGLEVTHVADESESEDEGEWECSKCGAIGHDEVKECEIRMEEEAVCDYCYLYAKDDEQKYDEWCEKHKDKMWEQLSPAEYDDWVCKNDFQDRLFAEWKKGADEGEWECERCGEGGKANDGAIKCRCGEEGVWSDDEAVCEEECVAWDDNGCCKRCGTRGGRAMITAVVTETMTAAAIEAGGGIQSVVTAWMNVKLK